MEEPEKDVSIDYTSNPRVVRVALVVIAVALVGNVALAWWSGQGIPSQVARLEGYDQLKLVRQARDGLERYIGDIRSKIRDLASEKGIITPGGTVADQMALDRVLTNKDLAEVQIRRFDPQGEQLLALPVMGQRFARPTASDLQELLDWAKSIDPLRREEDVRLDVVTIPTGNERQTTIALRYCTPVWKADSTRAFDGILTMWVSSDYLLTQYLFPLVKAQSYVFAVQSEIAEEERSLILLRHSAEPDWIRGGGKDADAFLNALTNNTRMFDEAGDDHDLVAIPQRDGRERKEVIAFASTILLPYRWTLGLSTPYEVVIEPYSPYQRSMLLQVLLTVGVLIILIGLLYYQRQRLQSEAREQRRRQLREMQHDYRELFAENPIAMLVINDQQQLADCNYSAERLLGISRQEAFNARLSDLFENSSLQSLWQSLQERGYAHARDAELVRSVDQTTVVVEAWGRRIGDHWVIMANDVEHRRDLERQIARLRRMDSMGSLASTLAHDFNNLLGQVQILVSNLRADLDPSCGAVEGDLAAIEEKVDDASQLVANLLAFREDVVSKDPVWLETVLREFVANERKIIPHEIHLDFSVTEEAPPVWITPYALRRVMDNLCRNACDAMRYGGELRIRLSSRRLDSQHDADQLPAGLYAVIEVSDTGVGMSPEMLDTIFEPFFSTKGQGSGTGLGLWTVYKIVRRAGGAVHVRSRVGKGTRFTIYLPNAKPQEDQS